VSVSLERFVQHLTQSGLMSAAEVSTFQDSLPPEKRPKDGETLARELVRANKLTKYQAQAVYGAMSKDWSSASTSYSISWAKAAWAWCLKARHRRMDRLVAIKILSSAAMKQAGAVERFHREVQAAAKLSHSNIVTAYDADEHRRDALPGDGVRRGQ
jgi:hypothetical protein